MRGLRELELRKAPSISETIDWARTLAVLGVDELNSQILSDTVSVVVKYDKDVTKALGALPKLVDPNAVVDDAHGHGHGHGHGHDGDHDHGTRTSPRRRTLAGPSTRRRRTTAPTAARCAPRRTGGPARRHLRRAGSRAPRRPPAAPRSRAVEAAPGEPAQGTRSFGAGLGKRAL